MSRGAPTRRRLAGAMAGALLVGLVGLSAPGVAQEAPSADLEVNKTVDGAATVAVGQQVGFKITVMNHGPDVAQVAVLFDELPSPNGVTWELRNGPNEARCTITGGKTLRCDIGDLGLKTAGQFFEIRVKATAPCAGKLENSAWAESSTPDPNLANNRGSASITVTGEPECDVEEPPPPPPPPPAGQGCTPGYWKNHTNRWDGVGTDDLTTTIKTNNLFNATFGVGPAESGHANNVTLLDAIRKGGGGVIALGRHAGAALASADSGISFGMTVQQVIDLYRDAVGAVPGPETIQSAHTKLEAANEQGCPLN